MIFPEVFFPMIKNHYTQHWRKYWACPGSITIKNSILFNSSSDIYNIQSELFDSLSVRLSIIFIKSVKFSMFVTLCQRYDLQIIF